jgi:ABC transporter substrate binding protein
VTEGPVPTIEAGKATPAIPIVFVQVPDPVDLGIVASLARPGRNITGFTHFELAFAGKWLETLKDMAPQTRRVLLVTLAEHPALPGFLRTITALESSSGVKATPAGVRHAAEIERAIDDFTREPNGGLIVLPSQIATTHRELIIALAARHRLPAIYPWRYFPESGGLSSYGIDTVDMFRIRSRSKARIRDALAQVGFRPAASGAPYDREPAARVTNDATKRRLRCSAAIAPAFEPSLCRLRSPLPGNGISGAEKNAPTRSPNHGLAVSETQRSNKKPANAGPFSTTTGNFCNRRNAWWAREDSNLQPDRYERPG